MGDLLPPVATLRRALSQRREVDGGSEGEERSPETATVGELLNFGSVWIVSSAALAWPGCLPEVCLESVW